jgi:hypothetical protein
MAATKADMGQVVTAYLDADREAGAREKRARAAAGDARAEQQALLEIEAALEAATRQKLS